MDRVFAVLREARDGAPGSPLVRGTPAFELDRYQALMVVGKGAFGVCKKVRRKVDGKILVWKEVRYDQSDHRKQLMVSEVNILRELDHPNIVRYYDKIDDRVSSTLYIVMEYCEGGDLASLIRKRASERRSLSEEFVLRVFAQLASALQVCHKRKGGIVLHRDLKPANIFLDSKANVKLGDFGIARILQHESYAKTFAGTPSYMSPEQMNGKHYNEKSDIWSLGCVLYELCALSYSPDPASESSCLGGSTQHPGYPSDARRRHPRRPPFKGSTLLSLAQKIKEGKFSRIPSSFSDELQRVISKMLNVLDCLRPSVDQLLQSTLLADFVPDKKMVPEKRGVVPRQGPQSEPRRANEKRVDHGNCCCREHSPCLTPVPPLHVIEEKLMKMGVEGLCDAHKPLKARCCQNADPSGLRQVNQGPCGICGARRIYLNLIEQEQQAYEQRCLKLGISPLRQKLLFN